MNLRMRIIAGVVLVLVAATGAWLFATSGRESTDDAQVDAYVADVKCGQVFTSGFFVDLLAGLRAVNDDSRVARVRPDLPILLIAGDKDPVGAGGKGPRAVREQYTAAGVADVTCTLYPGARHEIFNETNREEVLSDLVAWLDAHLPG